MRKEWMKLIPIITDNSENTKQIECPNCKKSCVEYIYIGDKKSRIGYLQVWCNDCLKGIYISRVKAPINAKFISFDSDLKNLVPNYDIVVD